MSDSAGFGANPWQPVWLAIASGVLAGLAFPPFGLAILIWVALAPLLVALRMSRTPRRAALYAGLAGGLFCFLILQPLTSAGAWTGWGLVRPEEVAALAAQREWVLRLVSLGLALVGGFSWAIFAAALQYFGGRSLMRWLYLAPALFVLVAEWARSKVSWDYQWGFLGVAAAETGPLRQLAAFGGIWLLSLLVVAVNVGIVALFTAGRTERRRLALGLATGLAIVWTAASLRLHSIRSAEPPAGVETAVVQHHSQEQADYSSSGLSRTYLNLIERVAGGEAGPVQLLVLPESVGFGAVSLDGSSILGRPAAVQHPLEEWNRAIIGALGHSSMQVVLGAETIVRGASYNSLLLWDRNGLSEVYDKRRLVPFGEYQPAFLSWAGLAGQSQFVAGNDVEVWPTHAGSVGPFICQEVLMPGPLHDTVLAGAHILVSGGNDGVFSSPAVAETHAQLSRLRAVETGRYVVRAMKTGVSAIISPAGEELTRAAVGEKAVLVAKVAPRRQLTPAVRWAPWPLAFAALTLLVDRLASWLRRRPS